MKNTFNHILRVEGSFEKHIFTDKLDAELVYEDYMKAGWFMTNDFTYCRRITDPKDVVIKSPPPAPKFPRVHGYSGFAQ